MFPAKYAKFYWHNWRVLFHGDAALYGDFTHSIGEQA